MGQGVTGNSTGGNFALGGGFFGSGAGGGCPTITVNVPSTNTGTTGLAFSQNFTQTGGAGTVTFTKTGALPTGVNLATNGLLSGTPTQTGSFPITVTATDTNQCTGSANYTLTINCPTITVNPSNPTLTAGTMGTFYSQTFTQTGGAGTLTWSNPGGGLPAGLTLNANTGVLSGTPTVSGSFNFMIRATDANQCTGERQYTLTLNLAGNGLQFYPLAAPVRLLDTRAGQIACS